MRPIIVTLIVLIVSTLAAAAPPKVVSTVPAHGDLAVDPGLRQITFTFDQPMDTRGGRSICGGGPTLPASEGQARWKDARTFIWGVKLEADKDYSFSVNCPSFRNFRGVNGESAVPHPVRFRTARAPGSGAPDQLTPAGNDAAIAKLREAIRRGYSYRDRLGLDWDALFTQHSAPMRSAKTVRQFASGVIGILSQAKDKHISIDVEGERVATHVNLVAANANAELLPKLVPNWTQLAEGIYTGRFEDGIGYIRIDGWSASSPVGAYHRLLEMLSGEGGSPRGVVIDVRLNGGGDEPTAQLIAGRFIDEPAVYAGHVYADAGSASGFSPVSQRMLRPVSIGTGGRYRGRVAVLSGPVVMSSCEAFVLMMKQAPEATVFGERTQGFSGNPRPHDLGNGLTVWLPSWKAMTAEGVEFEGVGIAPDVRVEAGPEDFRSGDPVLEASLRHLRQ